MTTPRPFRLIPRLPLLAVWLLATAPDLIAQNEPPVEQAQEQLPPPEVFLEHLRNAYRVGPIGEHVKVTIESANGRRTKPLVVYLEAATPDSTASLRIEFAPLTVWWADGALVAVSERNETTHYSAVLPGPPDLRTISEALRPLPLPQLQLAFADDAQLAHPTPYTPGTVWHEARMSDPALNPGLVVLEGTSRTGEVSLHIDPRTDRLRKFEARFGPPESPGSWTLTLECRPLDPPSTSEWAVETEHRTAVNSLNELLPREGPVQIGELVPEIELFDETSNPWRLRPTLAHLAIDPEHQPQALALIFFRHDSDAMMQAEHLAAARAGVASIHEAMNRPVAPRAAPDLHEPGRTSAWRIATYADVSFRLGQYTPGAYMRLRTQWGDGTGSSESLLWDHSPGRTIDWFHQESGAVLVLVAPDSTLLLIEPLEVASDPFEISRKIDAALRAAYPPYSTIPLEEHDPPDPA